jgi:hypothetical protein
MTGANPENVQTHPSTTAACLLLRLATPLFKAWAATDEGSRRDADYFIAWTTIRRAAEFFLAHRVVGIPSPAGERLTAALRAAHNLNHGEPADVQIVPAVEYCQCHVAQTIRELESVVQDGVTHAR